MNEGKSALARDTILIRNPMFVLREEEDGSLLFDPDTGAVRLLNATATEFFKKVDGRRTLDSVIGSVKAEFVEVDADADQQLEEITSQLLAMGAIGIRTENPAAGRGDL
jgi:hypothetical protein